MKPEENQRSRGSERFGLMASSKAQRLKPHAIDVRIDVDPVHWFLSDRDDTRSSYYLEDAATEFQFRGWSLIGRASRGMVIYVLPKRDGASTTFVATVGRTSTILTIRLILRMHIGCY